MKFLLKILKIFLRMKQNYLINKVFFDFEKGKSWPLVGLFYGDLIEQIQLI